MNYFSSAEMSCPCGCDLHLRHIDPDSYAKLHNARVDANTPFIITSSIRCKEHNYRIGGSPTSSHLTGHAFDIATSCATQRYKIVTALLNAGFTRIGIGDDYLHVDDDPGKPGQAMWTYE